MFGDDDALAFMSTIKQDIGSLPNGFGIIPRLLIDLMGVVQMTKHAVGLTMSINYGTQWHHCFGVELIIAKLSDLFYLDNIYLFQNKRTRHKNIFLSAISF